MKTGTIIVAAGQGKRFGGKKQFYVIKNKPVFLWSLEKFIPFSDFIVLVLPKEDIKKTEKILTRFSHIKKFKEKIKLVAGGKHRYDSVRNGLAHIPKECKIICIHDGVRPFVKSGEISDCISSAKKYGAAICAIPATDTVKLSTKDGFVDKTIDRNFVWLVQTPQVFKREIILKAYKKFGKKIPENITDDSGLVELAGFKVKIVKGSVSNIKITTKEDVKNPPLSPFMKGGS